MGTPVAAAAGGTVTYARYNSGGYGNLVIIDHGNGIQTYYAHNSKLYVSEGQTVSQGELISAMGSTGMSTGSHLHWEVRINGVAQNPQNYLYKGR
jgi:murein DD-endopeptidase MepM/ murein hydrolase activator NlpD